MPGARPTPAQRLSAFIDRYSAEVAGCARQARRHLRRLLPGAVELVYDNYNALVMAFGPTERPADLILSIALYPRWVSLFFARGVALGDPQGLLRGQGTKIRHVVLARAEMLARGPVRTLVKEAVSTHPLPVPPTGGRTIIQSVSAKRRPRRPARRSSAA